MNWRSKTPFATPRSRIAALASLLGLCAVIAAPAWATDIGSLQSKVDGARQQASALASDLEAKQRQMVAAQQQAAAATAREHQLSSLLAVGVRRPEVAAVPCCRLLVSRSCRHPHLPTSTMQGKSVARLPSGGHPRLAQQKMRCWPR